MNNPLISFLREIFLRLSARSPLFFQVWQWLSGAVAAVSGIPTTLQWLGVTMPAPYDMLANKTVAICGIIALFMSALTTQSKTVAIDQNGTPVKQSNIGKLPFTSQQENKAVEKEIMNVETPPVERIDLANPILPKGK